MKKLSLLIILLFSLLLISCGEVAEVTTPVETTPAATTPTVTTPAATTSTQYPYLLTRDDSGNLVFSGSERNVTFALSELEYIRTETPDEALDDHFCYDKAMVQELFLTYFPVGIPLRERRWPENENNSAYSLTIEYNDHLYGFVKVESSGRVFFYIPNPDRPTTLFSYVSPYDVFSYENVKELYSKLSSPALSTDRCDEFQGDMDYIYALRSDEMGNLLFERENETLDKLLIENIELIKLHGLSGILDCSLQHAPEKKQFLPHIFSQEVLLRPIDVISEEELRANVSSDASMNGIEFKMDLNDNQSYFIYITPDGRIMMYDTQEHYYISEPGACDGETIIAWAKEFARDYLRKYF